MLEILIRAGADAFLQVGVWVAAMLAVIGLLQWRTGRSLERLFERRPRLGPVLGAALGMMPGCGGAIVVMPLYTRGAIGFGTVVATLTATMGDSSFVLISGAPRTALLVHGLLVVVGLVTGVIVDAIGWDPLAGRPIPNRAPTPATSTVGAAAAPRTLVGRLQVRHPSPSLLAFWGLTAAGLALSVLVVFQLVPEAAVTIAGVNSYLVVGALGMLLCLVAFVGSRLWDRDRNTCEHVDARHSPSAALLHAARETAFVTTWVALAFLGWELLVSATGWDGGMLPVMGLAGVVAGAMIGLIPGCGPQILLTSLYVQGGLPLSVLVANALSQDGDALFPLLATSRRSAVVATAVTTVPGIVVGGALVAVGL